MKTSRLECASLILHLLQHKSTDDRENHRLHLSLLVNALRHLETTRVHRKRCAFMRYLFVRCQDPWLPSCRAGFAVGDSTGLLVLELEKLGQLGPVNFLHLVGVKHVKFASCVQRSLWARLQPLDAH